MDPFEPDSTPTETQEGAEPESTGQASGINPAWEPIKSQLDDISWFKIEPELRKMDQSAQQRITSVNEQYAPFKDFAARGITPDRINQSLSLAETLDANPAQVHQYLTTFLQQNGRMPTNQEVQEADDAGEIGEGDGEQDDPRLRQLEEQQASIQEFLADQQWQQQLQEASQSIDQEINTLKTTHADLGPEDTQAIIQQAVLIGQQNAAQGIDSVPSLEEVYSSWFAPMRDRFLSQPRSADSAPRLLPTSGGLSSVQPAKSYGQMSSQEIQELISGHLGSRNSGR